MQSELEKVAWFQYFALLLIKKKKIVNNKKLEDSNILVTPMSWTSYMNFFFALIRLPTAAPRNTEQHSSRPCALNQSKANFFLLLSLHLLFHLFFLFAIKQLGGRPYQNLHWKLGQQRAICWNSHSMKPQKISTHSDNFISIFFPLSDWVEILWGFTI